MTAVRSASVFLGDIADRFEGHYYGLDQHLREARIPMTYRSYMVRTYAYTIAAFVGVPLAILLLFVVSGITLSTFVLAGILLTGPLAGYAVHSLRIYYPKYVADVREQKIDTTLSGVTSFMFALVRGGMPLPEVLRTVADNSEVFGEAAEEIGVASRNIDYLGDDVVTALQDLSETTPSDEMSDFLKNFVSIVVRREDMSSYLENKSAEFHEMAEEKQKSLLDQLGILAEFYVVVFVAAPLFLITILVVMGFVGDSTLIPLRAVIYLLIPLSGVMYVLVLDMLFESPVARSTTARSGEDEGLSWDLPRDDSELDEETRDKIRVLETYELRKELMDYVRSPVRTLRTNPRVSLYVGAGMGVLYLLVKAGLYFFVAGGEFPQVDGGLGPGYFDLVFSDRAENALRAVDDSLIEALMISLILYAVFYQVRFEYLKKVEDELPEFLGRLANVNQAGIPISQSLASLGDAELGVLNEDVKKMARDIRWNSTAVQAVERFDERVRSPAMTRASVLLTKTSETSGRIARVLETAARDADLRRRLNVARRSEMSLYVVVIYISFMVFIVIVTILSAVFIPAIPQENVGDIPQLGGGFEPLEYQTLFYHASVIQGLFGGLIAGKMATGRASTGVKHAFIMIAVAYVTFTFFLPLI